MICAGSTWPAFAKLYREAVMKDLRSLPYEALEKEIISLNEPRFRAGQIFTWLHRDRATSFDEMTNISKSLRQRLESEYELTVLRIERMQESKIDGTRKYLFALSDGNLIESVLMRYHHGNTVCVSTQVGCRMGCRFCASTVDGLVRSLEPGEILEQIYRIETDIGESVNHVVLMGSGEPLDNYDNVVSFLRLITDPRGKNMSARNITVSTCGLPEGILKLADEDLPVTLALSLHAPDDETRKKLMPIANRYGLKEVFEACEQYFRKTGRRMTYEYSVVRGVNDTEEEAEKLGKLLHGKNAHVNLIPVNPIEERSFEKPLSQTLRAFQKTLDKYGINATIRRELGSDIDGACGQLRRRVLKEKGTADAS